MPHYYCNRLYSVHDIPASAVLIWLLCSCSRLYRRYITATHTHQSPSCTCTSVHVLVHIHEGGEQRTATQHAIKPTETGPQHRSCVPMVGYYRTRASVPAVPQRSLPRTATTAAETQHDRQHRKLISTSSKILKSLRHGLKSLEYIVYVWHCGCVGVGDNIDAGAGSV